MNSMSPEHRVPDVIIRDRGHSLREQLFAPSGIGKFVLGEDFVVGNAEISRMSATVTGRSQACLCFGLLRRSKSFFVHSQQEGNRRMCSDFEVKSRTDFSRCQCCNRKSNSSRREVSSKEFIQGIAGAIGWLG